MTQLVLPSDPLRQALLESRQRWQDLVAISADLAFETDARGAFVFVSPDQVLGWPARDLLGRPSELLLTESAVTGFNPFRAEQPLRNRRVWLRGPTGALRWMSFSVAPLHDETGAQTGVRGAARDVTELDRTESAMARSLRRAELVERMVALMRSEVSAGRMMVKGLHALAASLGADGAMVIDGRPADWRPARPEDAGDDPGTLLHETGGDLPALRLLGAARLADALGAPVLLHAPTGHTGILWSTLTRFNHRAGVIVWRRPGRRGWDNEDSAVLADAGAALRAVLEHGAVQREVARQARTDGLTGLPNRSSFTDELARRLDRLDQEGLPGTLILANLDGLRALNERHGPEAGDAELRVVAAMLRMATRPGDLCCRLGGACFALWLDGMDELAAAERAERIRQHAASALRGVGRQTGALSLGIASRWPGSGLDGPTLLRRAQRALAEVKQAGGGNWRVWHGEDGDER
jgi:diguanylate cyclase (GGDEF)-like protein/PAS domain S-box-containing protein